MSVSIDAIVNSTTYALSGRDPYAFISLTGLGLPPVRRIKERGPLQHGATDVGFLLDERMLNLALLITGSTLAAVDGYRAAHDPDGDKGLSDAEADDLWAWVQQG